MGSIGDKDNNDSYDINNNDNNIMIRIDGSVSDRDNIYSNYINNNYKNKIIRIDAKRLHGKRQR